MPCISVWILRTQKTNKQAVVLSKANSVSGSVQAAASLPFVADNVAFGPLAAFANQCVAIVVTVVCFRREEAASDYKPARIRLSASDCGPWETISANLFPVDSGESSAFLRISLRPKMCLNELVLKLLIKWSHAHTACNK
ncbi:uncharacterized protein LOC111270823 [Varroa jacobsoni]|uniref:uncharacterized protein LOC111270823 n=1 Tax=Varroa jacobsoni TaxID=62625 RepID=UPI000BF3EB6F|nr:uncharacterized protein LOC111270823 [Varroa jacobsoni]